MKVCFLINCLNPGGAERTVAYLSNYIVNNGADVDIVLFGDRGFYYLDDKIKIHHISQAYKSKNILHRLIMILKRFKKFKNYIRINKPDIVFCMLYKLMIYALPHKKRVSIIISERGNPHYLKSHFRKVIRKILFKKADGIVFQTERAKNFYRDIIKDKGIVIPNAIGNEYVYKVPIIEKRVNKIVSVGRLFKVKDYPTLLKAFKQISDKHQDYELVIYGQGPEDKELKEFSQDLGIGEKVFFMGAQPDALLKIADSKCYVLSSISEGMPNSLMEAMAIGLPCVSTDCPNGPAELIEDGVNGLLVPVGDENAMAKAILKMIEDEEFANKCGENAKKIKETHSVDYIAEQYLTYIKSVL